MSLSEDDKRIAVAARYMLDRGYDELARLVLKSKLVATDRTFVTVVCPPALYDLLSQTPSKDQKSAAEALRSAFRGLVAYTDNSFTIYPQLGIVDRDRATEAELSQLAEADAESKPVKAILTKPQQRPMLVTPIPILPVSPQKRDPILCFVIMPFAPAFRPIYEDAIRPAVQAAGLLCRRADDIMQPGDIMAQVWQSLLQASLVIADLTGVNGNVFYELGLAHVLGHQAILLT